MYIFLTISFVLLFSFTSYCAPKDNVQIEEFIDKLLTSDKFEKLADKIAEKAADKLIILQHANDEKKSDVNRANAVPPPKRVYSSEENKDIRKVTKKEIDRPDDKTVSSSENNKLKLFIDKHKMNTAATIPAGELSLNYKHFTTQVTSRSDNAAKYTAVSFVKKYDSNENSVEYPNNKRDHLNNHKYKNENNEMYKRVQSSSENSENSTESTSKRAKIESDVSVDNDSQQENKSSSEESVNDVSSTEEGSTSKFEVTTPKTTTIKEKHKKSQKKKKSHKKSKSAEAGKESPKVKTKNTSDESDDEKIPIADSANKNEEKKIDYRHMIREENGKLYKFEQSPDYEEYHEKLSKLLQSVQDKNKRRFNVKFDI